MVCYSMLMFTIFIYFYDSRIEEFRNVEDIIEYIVKIKIRHSLINLCL